MMFGADVSKQEKEETEILGAVGRISWFDRGAETVSRPLSDIFQDVSGAVWANVSRDGTTSEEAEK